MIADININLPVKPDGSPDIDAQKEIAEVYLLVEQLKHTAAEKKAEVECCTIVLDDTKKTRMTKDFLLSEIFEIKRGSGIYTKSYVQEHKGAYPLFSGNTSGKFAEIDSYDYEGHCLTWAIDGLAGYIMVHEEPFSATNHRGILIPKNNFTDLNYAKYILEPIFRSLKKGREGANGANEYTSLPPFMLEGVKIPLPVTPDGSPDLDAQKEIAEVYILIDQLRQTAAEKKAQIECCTVILDGMNDGQKTKDFPLPSLFSMKRGSSKYTKKYCSQHPGTYPVYSASIYKPLGYIDTYDYDGRYITWATDGFAGNIMIIDGKFSVNGARGLLIPIDGRNDIDFDYVKFVLEPVLRKTAKGRRDIDGGDEYTHLPPSMLEDIAINLPVKPDGTIDIDAQKDTAGRYMTIETCRQGIISQLDIILNQKVVL